MEKEELKKKLEDVKKNILANAKDQHFMKNQLSEFQVLTGQILREPTIVHVPIKDIKKEYQGDTFSMAICKDGSAVYHVYGGYTIVARANNISLVGTINNYIDASKTDITEEERKTLELDMAAFAYIMSLPMFVCGDLDFKYKIATEIIQYLQETYEKSLDEALHEETEEDHELNRKFEDATIALGNLREAFPTNKKD